VDLLDMTRTFWLHAPPASSTWPSADDASCLLVEDGEDARELAKDLLDSYGFLVLTAGSAGEAARLWGTVLPDVLILDVGLPDIDGFEVARELRRRADTRQVGLVAWTGHSQVDLRAREAGFDVVVMKPASGNVLARAVRGAAAIARARR
jgi:CheY-like chemotaxis protein